MSPRSFPFLSLLIPAGLLALAAGCQSAPAAKPAAAPAAAASGGQPAGMPAPTGAALEASDFLMKGGQAHELLRNTALGGYGQFFTQGWSGLVLSPKDLRQGIVCTSEYQVFRVELHPLVDGRVRVWIEFGNVSARRASPEVACEFRPSVAGETTKFRALPVLDARGRTIIAFESARPHVEGYSILVRSKLAGKRTP